MTEEVEKFLHGKISIRSGKAHIPRAVRKELEKDEVGYILDARTVVLCDPNMDVNDLLKSIELLIEHIRLKMKKNRS